MAFQELIDYIKQAQKMGITNEKIGQTLIDSGWKLSDLIGVITELKTNGNVSQMPTSNAIIVEGIAKSFGKVEALKDIHLTVPAGTVTALLGPNGAGKTTLVRILTTLLLPDSGSARVAGHEVVKDATKLRTEIGLTGQFTALDENLTARENMEMVGGLYHLEKKYVIEKSVELLNIFELSDASERIVKTFSGGMKRRLDLAMSLIHTPKVLFLDEPTTGLDPHSRLRLWAIIKDLVNKGTTVLLTTQYLEEADHLADSIAVLNHGVIIAHGTADQLKTQVGGNILELHVADHSLVEKASQVITSLGHEAPHVDLEEGRVMLPVQGGSSVMVEAVRLLDSSDIKIDDIILRRPTLDDVFLALTGHSTK